MFLLNTLTKEKLKIYDGFTVGRLEGSKRYPEDTKLSKLHFELSKNNNRFYIKDKNSTNKTFLNGIELTLEAKVELKNGNLILAGSQKFIYIDNNINNTLLDNKLEQKSFIFFIKNLIKFKNLNFYTYVHLIIIVFLFIWLNRGSSISSNDNINFLKILFYYSIFFIDALFCLAITSFLSIKIYSKYSNKKFIKHFYNLILLFFLMALFLVIAVALPFLSLFLSKYVLLFISMIKTL